MTVAFYGGSFNPPHPAHVRACRLACEQLKPDKLLVIPAATPPHKPLPEGSPQEGVCTRANAATCCTLH